MDRTHKIIILIISAITLSGMIWGSWRHFDSTYARASEVRQLEERLDYKIIQDQVNGLQDRIWKLDDRFQGKKMPTEILEEYRRLKKDKEYLEKKLDGVSK